MADFGSVIGSQFTQAQLPQQNAVANEQSTEMGNANIANAWDAHQKQVQDLDQQKTDFNQKQAAWESEQWSKMLSTVNPTLRQAVFNQYSQQKAMMGKSVDPNIGILMKDDDFIANARNGQALINQLDDTDKSTQAYLDLSNATHSATDTAQIVQRAGDMYTRLAQSKIAADAETYNTGKQVMMHRYDSEGSQIDAVNKEPAFQDRFKALQEANEFQQMVSDPNVTPNELAASFAKYEQINNPSAVIRPGTTKLISDPSQGYIGNIKQTINEAMGSGHISDAKRVGMLKTIQLVAGDVNEQLQQMRNGMAEHNAPMGVNTDLAFKAMPQWKPLPFDPSTGYAVRSAGPTSWNNLTQNAKNMFSQKAQSMGIKLDPRDPNFQQKYMSVLQAAKQGK